MTEHQPNERGLSYNRGGETGDPRWSPEARPESLDSGGTQSYSPEAPEPPLPLAGQPRSPAEGGAQAMPTTLVAGRDTATNGFGLVLKRAVSYIRVSTIRQAERGGEAEGFSIPAQRDANRKKAQSMGAVIVKEFVDRGESARSANRPELQRMLDYIREDEIDYVIVHKVDRLARNLEDDIDIRRQLTGAGVQLVSTTESIDQTPSGMLLHGIMASIAEFYSRNLSNEVVKGMTQKARRGGTTGRAPLGYRNVGQFDEDGREMRTVIVDEEIAHHITWAFRQYATGAYSLRELGEALTARGLRTVQTPRMPSRVISETVLHKVLTNPYYTGLVRFQGVTYDGRHQPLIDAETFQKVQVVLESRRFGERKKLNDHYLKSSLTCAMCGSRMFVQITKSKSGATYPYFVCGGRHNKTTDCTMGANLIGEVEEKVARLYDAIRRDITREVREMLESDFAAERRLRTKDATTALRDLGSERQKLEREQERLLQAHYADAVPLDLMKREQDRIRTALLANRSQVDALTADVEAIEHVLTLALDLIQDCSAAYRNAPGFIRKIFNQVFFLRIEIDEDRNVTGVLGQPFDVLVQSSAGLVGVALHEDWAGSPRQAKNPNAVQLELSATSSDESQATKDDARSSVVLRPMEVVGVDAEERSTPISRAIFSRKTTLVRVQGL